MRRRDFLEKLGLDVSDEPDVINAQCMYCRYEDGEFEKDVKQYEYINGTLIMGQKIFYPDEIKYLEIDGRTLVGEKEKK